MTEAGNSTPRKYWPLGQLVLARVKEFVREPDVIFWVYGFPILMTAALGLAFRNRPVDAGHGVCGRQPRAVRRASPNALDRRDREAFC